MKMNKLLIGILVVLLTAVCVMSGLLLSDHFKKKPHAASREQTTAAQAVINPQDAAMHANAPTEIRGTKLYASSGAAAGESAQKTMQQLVTSGFNTVMFLNGQNQTAFTTDSDTGKLQRLVSAAKSAGLYTAVMVSSNSPQKLVDFAKKSGVDALVLTGIFETARTQDFDALNETVQSLEQALQRTTVGTVLWDVPFGSARTADNAGFMAAFSKVMRRSEMTGIYTYTERADETYASDADQWITYASDKPMWFSLTDAYTQTQTGFLRAEQAFRQCSALLKLRTSSVPVSFLFTAFDNWANDDACAVIVKGCLQEGIVPESYLKTFKITNYNTTSITTTESQITFIGESNPAYPLLCNGQKVTVTEDGFFAAEYRLNVGKNTFAFANCGKTYVYTVQYNLDLIRSISPSGSLNTAGGSTIEIAVVAHRNATVSAKLGGTAIKMTSSGVLMSDSDNGHMDASSDYVTFTGKYTLPASRSTSVFVGTIQASASYQGISDSINGARVTITAEQKVDALPVVEKATASELSTTKPTTTTTTTTTTTETTATSTAKTDPTQNESETDDSTESASDNPTAKTSSPITTQTTTTTKTTTSSASAAESTTSIKLDPVITPYTYNGLPGTKRMCKIKTYYTETMPLSPLNDLSVPLTTPLPIGTFDFITGESSFDKYTYYNLGSGRRVYRKDVEVIEKGYAMPANTLTLVNSGTASGKTNIRLHLTWKVPFNAVLNGQKYVNDPHNRREYAVTSLNAKSLDITFYYTAKAIGQPNVASSGVISSTEWVKSDSPQTCTLRLHLRNASQFYGYSVRYNADDTLQISIKEKETNSISGKTVMLDPGHGGADGGAPCAVNSGTYNEAGLVLTIAEKTRAKLQSMGASVIMTRTGNTNITLVDRKRMARENNPDVFVSIHLDAATSSSGYGTTAFYYRPYSYALAKSIHTQLVNTYVQNIYGTQKSSIDRGTTFYPYSVTRIEECPSVLIECGFVSNLEECRILQNSKHQDSIATAIANGIRDYFASN